MNYIAPKSDFLLDSKRADNVMEMMLSPGFRRACEASLLHFAFGLKDNDVAAGARMDAARTVINILLNIGEKEMPSGLPKQTGLKPI